RGNTLNHRMSLTAGDVITVQVQSHILGGAGPMGSPIIRADNTFDGAGRSMLAYVQVDGTSGAGGAGVTYVALTMPGEFSVAGSPITGSGTLAVTKVTQGANTVYAGPTSGGAAAPAFRALVGADLPTQMSITQDASGVKLVNDATTPGTSRYYGTDQAGTRGYFALPVSTKEGYWRVPTRPTPPHPRPRPSPLHHHHPPPPN